MQANQTSSSEPMPASAQPSASGWMARSWLPVTLAAAVMAACFLVLSQIQRHTADPGKRTPMVFVLPAGWAGGIKIQYDTPEAPPLAKDDQGRYRLEIPRSGLFPTSSAPEYGHAQDEILRRLPKGGFEKLHQGYILDRKTGLAGDRREYFRNPMEMETRDREYRDKGLVQPDGSNILGRPYEIVVIRGDLD